MGRDAVTQVALREARTAGDVYLIELSLQPQHLLRNVEAEKRDGGAGEAVGLTVAGDAANREGLYRAAIDHVLNALADGDAVS